MEFQQGREAGAPEEEEGRNDFGGATEDGGQDCCGEGCGGGSGRREFLSLARLYIGTGWSQRMYVLAGVAQYIDRHDAFLALAFNFAFEGGPRLVLYGSVLVQGLYPIDTGSIRLGTMSMVVR